MTRVSDDPDGVDMATATNTINNTVSTITDQCVTAEARVGNNGSTGDYEVGIGALTSNVEVGQILWDANGTGGYDSGFVPALFSAEIGGGSNGVSWAVDGCPDYPLIYTGRTYGSIVKVKIRAAVRTTAAVSLTDVLVRFWRNGRLLDSYQVSTGPTVDTRADSQPVEKEHILEVVPKATDYNKVTISAKVRLQWDENLNPSPDDLSACIFLYAQSCASA